MPLAKSESIPCAFPYIQTHYFDLRPMGRVFKGYALFVSSGSFNGSEEIEVQAPALFPDILLNRRSLKSFEKKGEWSQSNPERIKSAMGGALTAGEYLFRVKSKAKNCEMKLLFIDSYLEPAKKISANVAGDTIEISWTPSRQAESFLVGLLPFSGEFPKDLFIISHPDHRGNSFKLRRDLFPRGKYWILVRSNEHLPSNLDVGYMRESWGVSETSIEN